MARKAMLRSLAARAALLFVLSVAGCGLALAAANVEVELRAFLRGFSSFSESERELILSEMLDETRAQKRPYDDREFSLLKKSIGIQIRQWQLPKDPELRDLQLRDRLIVLRHNLIYFNGLLDSKAPLPKMEEVVAPFVKRLEKTLAEEVGESARKHWAGLIDGFQESRVAMAENLLVAEGKRVPSEKDLDAFEKAVRETAAGVAEIGVWAPNASPVEGGWEYDARLLHVYAVAAKFWSRATRLNDVKSLDLIKLKARGEADFAKTKAIQEKIREAEKRRETALREEIEEKVKAQEMAEASNEVSRLAKHISEDILASSNVPSTNSAALSLASGHEAEEPSTRSVGLAESRPAMAEPKRARSTLVSVLVLTALAALAAGGVAVLRSRK